MSAEVALERDGTWAVEAEGLSKYFGHVAALRDINLRVPHRQFVSIIGPNGAGKTTLLRVLATLSRPSGGKVSVDGLDLLRSGTEVRRRIGFVSHSTYLYGDLSAVENLRFHGRMHGVPDLEQRIADLLGQVGLAARRDDAVRTLSRGMQQRLSIARAILHCPDVVLLDEPYTGLDRRAADTLTSLLGELLDEGRTVLTTAHDLVYGANMVSQVVVLMWGRIMHEASTALEGRTQETALSERELHRIYSKYVEAPE